MWPLDQKEFGTHPSCRRIQMDTGGWGQENHLLALALETHGTGFFPDSYQLPSHFNDSQTMIQVSQYFQITLYVEDQQDSVKT